MSSFVFSRHLSPETLVDFEVGIGVLFAAEEAAVTGSWTRWSLESARAWVLADGLAALANERLVWRVVDCLREGPAEAGVVEALAVLHEMGVVDLVGPALAQARALDLVA